ncbi:hypothetical protein [Rhodococcus opacus]|uniref:hypothetical protein n=1 Tax=Rhodococcus opacus TaxID=37919 RepID=UPI002948ED7A|nr:hypothetical protein [Rhodococcus opacus]MDV6244269.1 hypothetical protein [Rhodococcus opacus]
MTGKVVAAVLVLLLWSGGTSLASAAPPPTAQCAWQFMSDSTVLDVAFPDANATYWVLPYALGPGDTIELSGTYPAARYFSLNTYGTNFDTVDTLRDNQIGPDPGSGNPFADAAADALPATQKRWHATVVTGPADHSRNQIQALSAGADAQSVPVGFLIIRVYVPDDPASPTGGVPLPDVTLTFGGRTSPVPTCGSAFDPSAYDNGPLGQAAEAAFDQIIAGAASGAFPGNVPEATFVNPASTSGLFPNGDNKYVGAGLTYQPGRIVVVQGRAPTFPDTRAGQPVTAPGRQVRYWSMCQNDQVTPYPVVACAADFQTRTDGARNYTYVVAAPQDVPARAASDPTVTVLPWGSTDVAKKVLFLRYMLPSDAFYPQSVQASQNNHTDPATTMGPYYPRAAYCDTATFEAGGAAACL